ncbi:preflagellin peptidase FlaK [Halohasta litchfieldiae]|jgi:preflagellin peptidase FlaK|uniref:Preflagellin peptidase FlaK n=1 Tax=Halohasta litchfieldiae TaxID=1073996 RepID=A0A1H6TJW5_9EURY|nr:A24 family peptidase [Halohasta litchfieldiae]ATW88885.1 preflagellin peptidase FlaK [Halohasta litchfieldiae]SEI80363.1 preflagellin peptidase FlaK [Halohasta litchfieldiae]
MIASGPDLLRLVVLPIFAWAAWRDINTRRLPNRLWPPLAALGLVLLGWEAIQLAPFGTPPGQLFVVQVGISLLFIAPLGYAFWWFGAFGGADAKAMIVLAILLPTFPSYTLGSLELPLVGLDTSIGVFSLTILTNTVLIAAIAPILLGVGNLVRGYIEPKAMFFARPVRVDSIPDRHGKLFETPDGITRSGLDLDALRMYLRWRGTTLANLQAEPESHRAPETVDETHEPTDGGTHVGPRTDGGVEQTAVESDTESVDDPWVAERFFEEIDGTAYGSTPEGLRAALELLATTDRETLWVSPGLPFVVPMFVGLLVAFSYGDLLFGLFGWLGFF